MVREKLEAMETEVLAFLDKMKAFNGAMLIVIGFILCMFGYKMIKYATALFIWMTFASLIMCFFVTVVYPSNLDAEHLIGSGMVSVVGAAVITYFTTTYTVKFSIAFLGSWTLLSVGFLLIPLLGISGKNKNSILIGLYILIGVIGFVLGIKYADGI